VAPVTASIREWNSLKNMKNTSKYPIESLSPIITGADENKTRLSEMTAFSFGNHFKHPTIDWLNPFKQASSMVFLLRFTSEYETSKGSLELKLVTHIKGLPCQPSPEGGIVLFCLLVSV